MMTYQLCDMTEICYTIPVMQKRLSIFRSMRVLGKGRL